MAQFLNQEKLKEPKCVSNEGLNAMGKPVPLWRQSNALKHCQTMGLETQEAMCCIGLVVEQLERDNPYEAMRCGMKWLDLTGTYRLFAVLLTGKQPANNN